MHRSETDSWLAPLFQADMLTFDVPSKLEIYLLTCMLSSNILLFFSDGLDFYYGKKEEARKLVDFLQTVVPCK